MPIIYYLKLTPQQPLYKTEKINKYINYFFISQLKRKKKIKYTFGYIIKTERNHKRIIFEREKIYKWMATKRLHFKPDNVFRYL